MINDVFEYWRLVMQHPRARMDDKRRRLIKARIDDGYTAEDLKLAIEGCAQSAFHMGDNNDNAVYDSIELIFRSADKVDQFIAIAEQARRKFERRAQERSRTQEQTMNKSEVGDEHLRRIMSTIKSKRERML